MQNKKTIIENVIIIQIQSFIGCPPGTMALFDGPSNVLTQCNIGSGSSCPNGYNCIYSTLLSQSICCGAPGAGGKFLITEQIKLKRKPHLCRSLPRRIHDLHRFTYDSPATVRNQCWWMSIELFLLVFLLSTCTVLLRSS